ncbi:bifunctional DNA-binding transcriptional regulator/O6-methylguanine-DNA methyltransferase Ada [Puniceicoccaceae bacterium K14]|nr:bifunctional DNA-binding transcriptional regulator/O6-methylguanine-DNA methyltransferase Ada [Puniceicoccaceae bacterium K14]
MRKDIASISNDEKWKAVLERNSKYDNLFFYGVLTTGVFCKPSCSSREPLRKNVRFYDSPQKAIVAKLRPCKRCRPTDQKQNESIESLALYIARNAPKPLPLKELAQLAKLNPHHFQKKFKATIGLTPKQFQSACREVILKRQIKDAKSITEAIYAAGYGSSSRAYEKFDTTLAMNPKNFRKGGSSEEISYATAVTKLGYALIAATNKGICFLQFDDNESKLIQALSLEFPKAQILRSPNQKSDSFRLWIQSLNHYLEGKDNLRSLPLDIRGTVFQRLVWNYLQSIPSGKTYSYSEVAQAIGKPQGHRAVATACAANTIAIAIPCHRVIRGDGSLSGYRWGIERKAKLLELELKK